MFRTRFSIRRVWPPRQAGDAFLVIARTVGAYGTVEKLYTRNQWIASLCERAEDAHHGELWLVYDSSKTIRRAEPVTAQVSA